MTTFQTILKKFGEKGEKRAGYISKSLDLLPMKLNLTPNSASE